MKYPHVRIEAPTEVNGEIIGVVRHVTINDEEWPCHSAAVEFLPDRPAKITLSFFGTVEIVDPVER